MALILPQIKAPDIPRTASKVSQSQIYRPIDSIGHLKGARTYTKVYGKPTISALGVGRHCLCITSSIEYGVALDLDAWW